jgi:hypothetical protein
MVFGDVIYCQDLPSKLGMAGQLLVSQPRRFALPTLPCATKLKPRAGFDIPAIHVAWQATIRTSTPDLARGELPPPEHSCTNGIICFDAMRQARAHFGDPYINFLLSLQSSLLSSA